jgi:hypothetical protein
MFSRPLNVLMYNILYSTDNSSCNNLVFVGAPERINLKEIVKIILWKQNLQRYIYGNVGQDICNAQI